MLDRRRMKSDPNRDKRPIISELPAFLFYDLISWLNVRLPGEPAYLCCVQKELYTLRPQFCRVIMQNGLLDPKHDPVVHRTCDLDTVATRVLPKMSYVIRGNDSLVLVTLEKS